MALNLIIYLIAYNFCEKVLFGGPLAYIWSSSIFRLLRWRYCRWLYFFILDAIECIAVQNAKLIRTQFSTATLLNKSKKLDAW